MDHRGEVMVIRASKPLSSLSARLDTLTIFRNVLSDPVVSKLKKLLWLADEGEDLREAISAYGDFVASLYEVTPNLSDYIGKILVEDENFYVRQKAAGKEISPSIEESLREELHLFEEICALTPDTVKNRLRYDGFLPSWDNAGYYNLHEKYASRLANLSETGYGIFAKYTTFVVKDYRLEPVKYPDPQKLEDLYGYEREKDLVIRNTEALISGQGASNVLLYGDAGTGKSSTIKAIANRYASKGLRLVEVKKNQLYELPAVIEELSGNPLSFIIFIDDLSFSKNDDNFSALKAILEGSVSASGDNMAIYATSNRRHLLKETSSQREGDEIHLSDTLQETMSLAARFGLTVTFQKPGKDSYLDIVDALAYRYGLVPEEIVAAKDTPPLKDSPAALWWEDLHRKAEAHAIRTGGRTPRTAKQFIELQKIGI